ncbi:MAG TPA: 50S ribosomal protein L24 [Desulfotomaculum sp.]|nr:50S ribosomal protein L24 [Desulfotomaculum sp.]
MPKLHVRKGDTVLVITGKDAGKRGKILSCLPEKGRVIVEGVNKVKRHTRPTQRNPRGGIMEMEAPIHASNVMLFCSKCNSPTRVAKKFLDDGRKVRVCRKCGEELG